MISELMQATFVKGQHHLRTQNISKSFHHRTHPVWYHIAVLYSDSTVEYKLVVSFCVKTFP